VDTQALNSLFERPSNNAAVDKIQFTYIGYEVVVFADGEVHVSEA